MHQTITFSRLRVFCFKIIVVGLFLVTMSNLVNAQVTITTETGTNYTAANGIVGGDVAITFVVTNNNATDVTLNEVDCAWNPGATAGSATPTLWYSATDLSGAPTISTPAWTVITSGPDITPAAAGIVPTFTGLSFTIPAGATYRFAIESTNGINYTSISAAPTPNIFSSDGVDLEVGDYQIAGGNVGYSGGVPGPLANNPRFFTGRIIFTTGPVCTAPDVPTINVSANPVLSGGLSTLSIASGNLNSATDWQWYTGSCGGTPVGSGTSLAVHPTATTTYYVRGEGGCVTPGNCASTTVTVGTCLPPAAPTVFPAALTICNGAPLPMSIVAPVTGYGASTTQTFTTGPISVDVPDNNPAGVTSVLNIAGVPAGANITSMKVTLNMTHTWIGDMVFVLKAPNGKIFNLDYNLSNTGGAAATTGFVNTVISSTGTTHLGNGNDPYTATFKADGTLNLTGAAPQGPTGMIPNITAWSGLYTIASGNWTLGMYDGGTGDVGTLTSWSITMTYAPPIPVPGVWSPTTDLYTDAAATIPYTGTPAGVVYAKPGANTSYSVTISSGACTSPATTIPVTVNTPVTINAAGQPVNKAVCTDKVTFFTVTAAGTTPTFQWQDSTSTHSWQNITNGGVYAGATNDTLVITAPPSSMNGNGYRCIVSGTSPCGAVNSNTVLLTVNPLPTITISSSPYTSLYPGLVATLSASSSPVAPSAYSWIYNGVAIPGATAATYDVDIDHLGDYSLTLTDVNGCTNTSGIYTINDSASNKLWIYPSPNLGHFQVRYHSAKGNILARTLTVYDSKGAKVLQGSYTIGKSYDAMNVDLTNFGRGVYFVELGDFQGKRIAVGRVVVD